MYSSYRYPVYYGLDSSTTLIITVIILFVSIFLVLFNLFLWIRIFSKTGHGGLLGCLMLIPFASFFLMIYLAFSEWPIERELKEKKK